MNKRFLAILAVFGLIAAAIGGLAIYIVIEEPDKPKLTTLQATNTTNSSADLEGEITSLGDTESADIYFEYKESEINIVDPYSDVDWDVYNQYSGQHHSHSSASPEDDRYPTPYESIVDYHEPAGYDFKSFGDSNYVAFPWSDYGISEEDHDLLEIPGHEAKPWLGDHMIIFFTEYEGTEGSIEDDLDGVEAMDDGGLVYLAHPPSDLDPSDVPEKFEDYDELIGFAAYNNMRESDFFRTGYAYEEIADYYTEYGSPDNPVWMFGESDWFFDDEDHEPRNEGASVNSGYNLVLAENLTEEEIREAYIKGEFFWIINNIKEKENFAEPMNIQIKEIETKEEKIEVTVEGDYNKIAWIHDKEVIHEGDTFNFIEDSVEEQDYVRFEVWYGEDDREDLIAGDRWIEGVANCQVIGSQPFYLQINNEENEWNQTTKTTQTTPTTYTKTIDNLQENTTYKFQITADYTIDKTEKTTTSHTETFTTEPLNWQETTN